MPLSHDWNNERLETLKKMFPDLFTNEGKLNIEELKKVVDPKSVAETERYEFRWFGKSQAKRNAFTPSNATLIYDDKRSVNPTESQNLIIEGENLEVLKLLSASYRGEVKCIYIDPPYNTGKDFVYSDNFSQDKKAYWEDAGVVENGLKIDSNTETDGRYHSNWLNMMYSRLLIARQLLREDGVIFISIDDNEVHHLRKLCDEVFGEDNFISDIIWEKRYGRSNDARLMASVIDHIILYRKSDEVQIMREPRSEENNGIYSNPDNDPRGDWTSVSFASQRTKDQRPNLAYKITNPFTNEEVEHPTNSWKFSKEKYNQLSSENRFYWGKDGKQKFPRIKRFLEELPEDLVPVNLWKFQEVGTGDEGTKEVNELVGKDIFSYPKPSRLLKRVINLALAHDYDESEDNLILDFFGGSGSTAQAVTELNQEDGGNRKYILVQIPEATDEKGEAYKNGYKKISDITIERNKRAIQKLIEDKKNQQPNLFTNGHKEDALKGLGFKVFKLVKSNFPRVEFAPDPEKTEAENIELLKKYIRDKEAQLITAFNHDELMTEILLKNGFNLNYQVTKLEQFKKNEIYLAKDSKNEILICLDVTIEMDTVEYFKKNIDKKFICLERALDTTKKYNLKHYMGDKFKAF